MTYEQGTLAAVEALRGDAELAAVFVAEALDHLGTIESTLLRLEEEPANNGLLDDVFRPFHTIKGNAAALGVGTVQSTAHTVEELLHRCRSGRLKMGHAEVSLVLRAVDVLSAMIADLADRAKGQTGVDLSVERNGLIADVQAMLAEAVASGTDVPAEPRYRRASDRRAGSAHASIKVDVRKLDTLVESVGELVILQSLIEEATAAQTIDPVLLHHVTRLRRIASDLQNGSMALRTVPIRQTFQWMARVVRDLAQVTGKPVEVVLSGESTELDRRIVEDIGDPLVHIVRNCLDHGIESRDRRLAANKGETGTLALRAFHQGNDIVIEVEDDGGGLDTDAILKKAVSQGLIAAGATPGEPELFQLIFAPGFSTASTTTELSGRGVGMDVVRRNIEALRGRIDITSERGRGTTFTIRLPLTLAILHGLVVRAGHQRYVIPTFAVREAVQPTAEQIHLVGGEPRLVRVHDRTLPLVSLRALFGLDDGVPAGTLPTFVVVEDRQRQVALAVDELIGTQEVVVKPLGGSLKVTGIAGATILGDGRVGLILDAEGVLRLASSGSAPSCIS